MTIFDQPGDYVVEITQGSIPGPPGDPGQPGPPGPGVVILESGQQVPPDGTPADTLVFRKRPA